MKVMDTGLLISAARRVALPGRGSAARSRSVVKPGERAELVRTGTFATSRRSSTGESADLLPARAMIAAAGADGPIDAEGRRRILERLDAMALSAADRSLLLDDLHEPLTLLEIAEQARAAGTAVEVYSAAVLAVDVSRPQGRVYLQNLAEILALPLPLVRRMRDEHARGAVPDEAA